MNQTRTTNILMDEGHNRTTSYMPNLEDLGAGDILARLYYMDSVAERSES